MWQPSASCISWPVSSMTDWPICVTVAWPYCVSASLCDQPINISQWPDYQLKEMTKSDTAPIPSRGRKSMTNKVCGYLLCGSIIGRIIIVCIINDWKYIVAMPMCSAMYLAENTAVLCVIQPSAQCGYGNLCNQWHVCNLMCVASIINVNIVCIPDTWLLW